MLLSLILAKKSSMYTEKSMKSFRTVVINAATYVSTLITVNLEEFDKTFLEYSCQRFYSRTCFSLRYPQFFHIERNV